MVLSTLTQPQPCASLNLVPASTSCQPQPRTSLDLVPASTSCQPQPSAILNLVPASTSCQPQSRASLNLLPPEPRCQPCPGCVRIFPPTLRSPIQAGAGLWPRLVVAYTAPAAKSLTLSANAAWLESTACTPVAEPCCRCVQLVVTQSAPSNPSCDAFRQTPRGWKLPPPTTNNYLV